MASFNSTVVTTDDDFTKRRDPRGRCRFLKSLLTAMTSYGKECCFSVAVIFTLYAALQSSPLKTRSTSQPAPFFSKHSPVADFYWGNVHQVFDRMLDSDITFMFYYAPWDAASMDVRWEFEKTAKYYESQVYFAAVNCWWPDSECRRQFPKIHSYPILIAYRNNGRGIQFRGPHSMPYMVTFLKHAISPLAVLHSRLDLLKLLSKHNAVVVGFFNFNESPHPPGYMSFYIAALKALEKDPAREISFAVISNIKDALKFGINATGTIHMHFLTSTEAFLTPTGFTSQKLLNWIFEHKLGVLQRIMPPGVKSLLLSDILENTPTVIMLTPRFVSASLLESPFYYLFKEVALEYLNCNNSMQVDKLIRVMRMELLELKLKQRSIVGRNSALKKQYYGNVFMRSCCFTIPMVVVLKQVFTDITCNVCILSSVQAECSQNQCDFLVVCDVFKLRVIPLECFSVYHAYNPRQRLSACCFTNEDLTNQKNSKALNLWRWSADDRGACLLSLHSHVAKRLNVYRERELVPTKMNFSGIGCASNKTLAFVVMDALNYAIFFSQLGVDVLRDPSLTSVAIVDNNQESYYVLEKRVTAKSIREFILNYTMGNIERYQRSTSPAKQTLPFVPAQSQDDIRVMDVSSSNFNFIMAEDKDVILFVYTSWCAFCAGISHIFLSAARYFEAVNDVVFARINGDLNDLPWEFEADKYPTILLFPAYQKHNSLEYPDDQPITLTGLIHFILAHAKLDVKLRTVLSLCSASCIAHNRKLALSKISTLLNKYRTLDGRYKGAVSVIRRACSKETQGEKRFHVARVEWYMSYAKHVLLEMCSVLLKLSHAKTLHLVLSTSQGERMSSSQLKMLTSSHDDFQQRFVRRECLSLNATLNNSLRNCSIVNKCV